MGLKVEIYHFLVLCSQNLDFKVKIGQNIGFEIQNLSKFGLMRSNFDFKVKIGQKNDFKIKIFVV